MIPITLHDITMPPDSQLRLALIARRVIERLSSRSETTQDIMGDLDNGLSIGMSLDFFQQLDHIISEEIRSSIDLQQKRPSP